MKKAQAQLILGTIAVVYLLVIRIEKLPSEEFHTKIAEGVIIPFILSFLIEILENIRLIKIYILSKTIYLKDNVRFSVAYLFLIKVDNDYLLVKNEHRNHFQLVGGVYKSFPEANVILEKLGAIPDKVWGSDKIRKNDLRLFLPMKNAVKFINWFKSEKDRETSPCREFYEELIKPNFLPQSPFLYINFKKKGTIITPIQHKKQDGHRYKQIQIFDIFEYMPNEEQQIELDKLRKLTINEIKWASEKLIVNDGYSFESTPPTKDFDIGQHTLWAIKLKYIP